MTASHRPYGAPAPNTPPPKRSLVLAGGGIRLSYAAGCIKALIDDAGMTFQHMDGTSGGSINLAMLLSGLSPDEMVTRWRTLNMLETLALPSLKDILDHKDFVAAGSTDGFRNKAFPHLGIDLAKMRAATGLQASFNMCNFSTKTNQVFDYTDMDMDLLLAGMSLPGVFPPLERDGQMFLDSGFLQDCNLMECVKRGSNELWLVWILGNTPDYRSGLLNLYVQCLEMAANAALNNQMAQIADINKRIESGETVLGHHEPIRLHIIKPIYPLPLDTALYTCQVTHTTLIEMGYRDAHRTLQNMQPTGVKLEPSTITMRTPQPGLSFCETMKGGVTLGKTDPKDGKKGPELAIHVQVMIRDMDRFINDPNHKGELVGCVDYQPWGKGILGYNGVFNLFSPSDDPKTKYMVYAMAIKHEGKDYYVAGKKKVREDKGFDLWSDTTTLFTQLHEGADASGKIIGAGVLTLGMTDLIKLVSTIQVHGTQKTTEKTKVVGQFGSFFMGSLWDTYAKHMSL